MAKANGFSESVCVGISTKCTEYYAKFRPDSPIHPYRSFKVTEPQISTILISILLSHSPDHYDNNDTNSSVHNLSTQLTLFTSAPIDRVDHEGSAGSQLRSHETKQTSRKILPIMNPNPRAIARPCDFLLPTLPRMASDPGCPEHLRMLRAPSTTLPFLRVR